MNYRVTEQYARSEETLVAEFNTLNDANLFMSVKQESPVLIHRLYDDELITHESNPGHISISYAQYAEGSADVTHSTHFHFCVMLQAENKTEKSSIANFQNKQDAFAFVINKCATDQMVNVDDLFFIFNEQYIVDTLSKAIIATRKKGSELSDVTNKRVIFNPTPLNITPHPSCFPVDYWVEEDEK